MNTSLFGRTALVGGASQGIGAAIARELALLGANVILMARNESKLKEVEATLDRTQGQQHFYIIADTTRPADVKMKVEKCLASGTPIHILVNNTGGPVSGPMIETRVEDIELAFRSHLITSHLLAQTLIEGMKAAGYGRIVNILSTSVKEPLNNLGISNSVRAAVANWGKTLANEIAEYGITVNNVLPGYIKTDRLTYLFGKEAATSQTTIEAIMEKNASLVPAHRLGDPAELAAAVAFLCSPAAAYINGINLPVDGGRLNGL